MKQKSGAPRLPAPTEYTTTLPTATTVLPDTPERTKVTGWVGIHYLAFLAVVAAVPIQAPTRCLGR